LLFRLLVVNYRPLTRHMMRQIAASLIFSTGFVRICDLITLITLIVIQLFIVF